MLRVSVLTAPIALSGGFSVETLTGVTLSWKTEYPGGCSTAIRRVARKVAAVEDRLVWFRSGLHRGNVVSGQVDLYMTHMEYIWWP